MRYWLCTIGGLALAGISIVLLDNGIFHVVRIGTCGTNTHFGSSFQIAPPCPPGTGGYILSIIGGVFGGLIAVGIYAARGARAGSGAVVSFGVIMWTLLFVTIALSIIYAAYGPGNTGSSTAKTTAIILGVVFIPMGLAPLPFALRGSRKPQVAPQLHVQVPGFAYSPPTAAVPLASAPAPVGAATPGPAPVTASPTASGEDPLAKIEALGKLRDRGLLTPAEFDAQKKRLLGEV